MAKYQITLISTNEGEVTPAFEMTIRGYHIADVVGEVLHAAIINAGDDGPLPTAILEDIIFGLSSGAASCEEDPLRWMRRLLRRYTEFEGDNFRPISESAAAMLKGNTDIEKGE